MKSFYYVYKCKYKFNRKLSFFCARIQRLDKKMTNKYNKFTAIVPSFNEGKRFKKVIKVLLKIGSLDSLIFVDDGSTDNTEKKSFFFCF